MSALRKLLQAHIAKLQTNEQKGAVKIIINPITHAQRTAALEKIMADAAAGSADAKSKLARVVKLIELSRQNAAARPTRVVPGSYHGAGYEEAALAEPAREPAPRHAPKPRYIDPRPALSAGPYIASELPGPPAIPLQLQTPSHHFEQSGRRRSGWPIG